MVLIGVDPGKKTGMAFWNPKLSKGDPCRLILKTFGFWDAYEYLTGRYPPEEVAIFIEDPGRNKPTFGRKDMKKAVLDRKSQNVGSNKEQARLLIEGFRRKGYVVFAIRPGSAKWSRKQLKLYSGSGYDGPSNQHERDSARLVVGRATVNTEQFQQLLQSKHTGIEL